MLHLTRQSDNPPVADLSSYEQDVEQALKRGFPYMYFPARLEQLFEAETGLARSRHLVIVGILWILFGLLYVLFPAPVSAAPAGFLDLGQMVRLGLVTPIIMAVTFAIWWGVRPFVREFLMMVACIVAPASVILLVTLAHSGDTGATRGALTVVLLFITVVVRLRFWFATVACVALVALQTGVPAMLSTSVPGNVAIVVATIVATLVANYTLEREYRFNYLQRIHGRIQGGKLNALVSQLHELSWLDALTGLPNRRALDSQLEELCARSEPFSVILIDVDSFKLFNDNYGHQVGDDCLRRIAAMLRASLRRTSDRVTRMGGEEFVVILPGTRLDDARTMAERMRKAIFDLRIPHVGSPSDDVVTISAGVSEARPPTVPDDVLSQADTALYQAKSGGRNRVVVFRAV